MDPNVADVSIAAHSGEDVNESTSICKTLSPTDLGIKLCFSQQHSHLPHELLRARKDASSDILPDRDATALHHELTIRGTVTDSVGIGLQQDPLDDEDAHTWAVGHCTPLRWASSTKRVVVAVIPSISHRTMHIPR